MQTTSAFYNAYPDARYSNMRVSFRLIDTTAQTDATASGTGYNTTVSQIVQSANGTETMTAKWATLETGGWPLDGSCSIMPDSVSSLQTGWWSNISDSDGNFSTSPTLTFNFASAHSSIGFTVFFDDKANQYPKSMTITAYDASNAILATQTVTCKSIKQVVEMPVTDYRKVVLSFSGTQQPNQSVRVAEVVFGIVQQFDKDNMTQSELLYEVAPLSDSQPCGQMTITIDNSDHKYNMLSPNSLYSYLQQGQYLQAEIGAGGSKNNLEYVNMGKFYFAKSEAADDSMTAKIMAYDRLYQLGKTTYRKGTNSTATVSTLINAVLTDANIGLTASIPTAIGSRIIGSCIPLVSHREAIRIICEAASCVAYINRNDVLVLADISAGTVVDTLDGDNMYAYPTISVSDRVNTAYVSVYTTYTKLSTTSVKAYMGTVGISGTQTIWVEYSARVVSPSTTLSSGTLNSAVYYMYGALLTITASGSITITISGTDEQDTSESTYAGTNKTITETEQAVKVQNPLITSTDMASAVATWLLAQSRYTYSIKERGNPARELLDTVTITDAYAVNGNAVITREQYTFDGGLSCQTKAVK